MIITSHMQEFIEIYPCLLKLSRKQESVTDGRTAAITIFPHRFRGGDNNLPLVMMSLREGLIIPWQGVACQLHVDPFL